MLQIRLDQLWYAVVVIKLQLYTHIKCLFFYPIWGGAAKNFTVCQVRKYILLQWVRSTDFEAFSYFLLSIEFGILS